MVNRKPIGFDVDAAPGARFPASVEAEVVAVAGGGGGALADGSVTYPKLASSGTGGTSKFINVSAGGVMSLTTPAATAIPGSTWTRGYNVVTDFGADPNGGESGPAFRNAAAAAQADYRPIWVPPGVYGYTGAGMTGNHIHIEGGGDNQSIINLGAGVYFIDTADQFWSFHMEKLFFNGGAGHVRNRYTGSNVNTNKVIQNCNFKDYTNCSIQSNGPDGPDWKIVYNHFEAANYTTSMGIALKGYVNCTEIIGNEFKANRVHVKLDRGDTAYVEKNAFLRFDASEGFPRVDLWMVPGDAGVDSNVGQGFCCTDNKFGNEFLEAADWRIVFADEAAGGTYWGDRFPSLGTTSTKRLTGHTYKGNYHLDNAFGPHPLIYSRVPDLRGFTIGPNTMGGIAFAPVLRLATATGFSHTTNRVGPLVGDAITQAATPSPVLVTADAGTLSGQPLSL